MLHVTNGDCAVAVLRAAGIRGDFLPWRDVLHEGPLDPCLSLRDLSEIRARFVADCRWAGLEEARKQFDARDRRLERAVADEEVVLWFEHDLYDQLQLLQLLAWFHDHPHPRLSMVCEAEYLGEMEPARAAHLFRTRMPVTPAQLRLGSRAWKGLNDVESLVAENLSELPFLDAALQRWLQERPGADGLSRTERQALEALRNAGPLAFAELFRRSQAREEARFLGDTVFLKRLESLEKRGLVRRDGERWKAV
jgi:hypothetical protein